MATCKLLLQRSRTLCTNNRGLLQRFRTLCTDSRGLLQMRLYLLLYWRVKCIVVATLHTVAHMFKPDVVDFFSQCLVANTSKGSLCFRLRTRIFTLEVLQDKRIKNIVHNTTLSWICSEIAILFFAQKF